ncbi:MAG: alcohol dehydrogenase catalytic domain-containing protein [Rhodospirillaceae bacterium]|jgi:2-desacetyl-2-hydroxyethyl bacteriochlorophyllide A dehydrogenase|nr:alcohol dehydrogenase catalytic domain-containing protein [Rhodospirillaceae bacterium]MBT3811037.1 alcohol dehydrogenase catalytic domain-containing protein [Rhodospirillaceae bacterium]MBT4771658.1 alcohol dehydrogenase catalytic domain-containing protein [Rhodospirillaceae bacterium]MBT5357840.1 alcohol dehydrogenase catalytic domain-containing protein [Rhodospirillaceae bacterium]MBT5768027.1 alcohol dehydrogenase catalytic domain-containing protein [Rhodospirillaceae bacterium]
MRAMVLTEPNVIEQRDIPEPTTDQGEALVRVSSSGICGTDLKILSGGIPAPKPIVMGHEMVGELLTDATDARKGQRVLVDPVYHCGTCHACLHNQQHICTRGGLIGRDINGGFADLVAVPPANCYVVPDEIADHEVPLIQVLTTCMHGHRMANIFPGDVVVVLGLGVTGQLHVQLAKARGATVIGITRSQWKLDLAKSLGADYTYAPSDDIKDKILEVSKGDGADLVIESAGKVLTLGQAFDMVRTGGAIMPFGIYTETKAELPFYQFYFKEIQILNARASKGQDFVASMDLVKRGMVKLDAMISDREPLENLSGALDMLTSEATGRMKIIMDH